MKQVFRLALGDVGPREAGRRDAVRQRSRPPLARGFLGGSRRSFAANLRLVGDAHQSSATPHLAVGSMRAGTSPGYRTPNHPPGVANALRICHVVLRPMEG